MATLEHFSHKHPLILKEENAIGDEVVCYGCQKIIIGNSAAAAYSCTSDSCDFFLHKTCAELPGQINHPMHHKHPLDLLARPPYDVLDCVCNICKLKWQWFTYSCVSCEFDVCMKCVLEDRAFRHRGHNEDHALSLMQRPASFICDACGKEDKDSSYACHSCQFWIHRSCASLPASIEPDFHKHPLVLTYSIPEIYRTFCQFCEICETKIHTSYWSYCCDKCRYFVHLKCATAPTSFDEEEIEADNFVGCFALPKESSMDALIEQFGKSITLEGEDVIDRLEVDCHDHPLFLQPQSKNTDLENRNTDEMLICNGCAQPISAAHPVYGCVGCSYFLHKFCAELPEEYLPAGECACHPEHPLSVVRNDNFLLCEKCDACEMITNGFFFWCETCDIAVDMRCCFLPNIIKHEAHQKHPLVQRAASRSACSACGDPICEGMEFGCETCSKFQIHRRCALFPGMIRHRWDPHPIPLICHPLFYEGVMYCEICEEEVNPKSWLYHCGDCDQSFHPYCLSPFHNAKLGGTLLQVEIHPHTLTHVMKISESNNSPLICGRCGVDSSLIDHSVCLECARCDFLLCKDCVIAISVEEEDVE